jgi:hypothetical protein
MAVQPLRTGTGVVFFFAMLKYQSKSQKFYFQHSQQFSEQRAKDLLTD